MVKPDLGAEKIFWLITAAGGLFGIFVEPVKTLTLLAWTLLVAGAVVAGEIIYALASGRGASIR